MERKVRQFIFDTFKDCFQFMEVPLTNYDAFTQSLSHQIQIKEGGNIQFSFDVELDQRIKDSLTKHEITGTVFSEESGWYELAGEKRYKVIYDPFCNSSLAARAFREGALGISFFTYDNIFITSAILDFQTGLMAIVDGEKTKFFQIQTGKEIILNSPSVDKLNAAWIVFSLETRDERLSLDEASEIFRDAKRVIISSGHMYWLKLAAGFIDAYIDPFGGEELYEMFASAIAQRAGCKVTDRNGIDFDPSKYLKTFEQDRHFTYYPIAARSEKLHKQLLESL